jgi:hypothetical protein
MGAPDVGEEVTKRVSFEEARNAFVEKEDARISSMPRAFNSDNDGMTPSYGRARLAARQSWSSTVSRLDGAACVLSAAIAFSRCQKGVASGLSL